MYKYSIVYKKYTNESIVNNIVFTAPPTITNHKIYPLVCYNGDAIPRIIAGINWDSSIMIYLPFKASGTDTSTVYYFNFKNN